MKDTQRQWLSGQYDGRVTFKKRERKLYGHDIAEMPSLIKPLVGQTIPDAVVQPMTEQEVSELAAWASSNNIALTPRGKASSGYGGVLPLKQGIVVDFYRMRGVIDIDERSLTASVEPGIVWERLDAELEKRGLTLRLYPSSYPASTVGGWLAQGGSGYGSYEYGWFRDNVVSARVVRADGTIDTVEGDDLDTISDAEGITGLITQVTIKVEPKETIEVTGITTSEPNVLQAFLSRLAEREAPVWSVIFTNPTSADLKNNAPLREHWGHAAEARVVLPKAYITTVAYKSRHKKEAEQAVREIASEIGATMADKHVVEHEWTNRFKTMVVKRLGPSLVPAEIRVPLAELGAVFSEINDTIAHPVVKEGIVIKNGRNGQPEVVILGFIPADQRKFGYNFVFALSLTILKIAERHGGGAYSTGAYFSGKAAGVLGDERLRRLRDAKEKADPNGILNPGKVIGDTLVSKAVAAGALFEPLARRLGNAIDAEIGERPSAPVRGIPADVAWYAYACSQCGYCVGECDQFYGRGWESQSPRGKWYWLREFIEGREDWDQEQIDTFLSCTTCEMCNTRCSSSLPIEESWMKLRGKLVNDEKEMTFPPFEMMKEALLSEGNIWAGYRKDRSEWFPEDLMEKHGPDVKAKNVYFAGCTASYVEKDIAQATVRLLDEAGVEFTYLGEKENCCGTPMKVAGKLDTFDQVMIENVENVKRSGADTVISSCPACDMMWRHVYPDRYKELGLAYNLAAKHYSELVSEKIADGSFVLPPSNTKETVTWHDSCHIGRASGVYEPPRDLIKAVGNVDFVEMQYNHDCSHCCGSVLTLIKEPGVAADIGKTRIDEAVEAGAEKILALCPCCEVQLRVSAEKKGLPVEIEDLARFTASKLGYEFPDPEPEVRYQWGVFEKFIALMTPEGFAALMGTMWPELIDVMPLKMGSMMRLMGRVPGALSVMRPLFPVLFPRLLPVMMPKLMPTMLDRVNGMIDMPAYMREQMPELMPKVMDSLMPHMIGDVVPLVIEPMIDYLKSTPQSEAKEAVSNP